MTITAVILNWIQCRLTLGAIRNFRKYYPDIPLIVIDNGTQDVDDGLFNTWYNKGNGEEMFDKDLNKLRNAQKELNFRLIELPENIGQGSAIDVAVDEIETDFMLVMDNDARLLDGKLLGEYVEQMKDDVFAVGIMYPENPERKQWVGLQFGLFRLEPIKKYHLTFNNFMMPYGEKEIFVEPGCLVNDCLVSDYPDRTRKIKWRRVLYPRIEQMQDRIVHLKVYVRNGEQLERFNKWIDG